MSAKPAAVEAAKTAEAAADISDKNNAPDFGGWDGDDDPRNPMNWSTIRKVSIITLVAFATLNEYRLPPSLLSPVAVSESNLG